MGDDSFLQFSGYRGGVLTTGRDDLFQPVGEPEDGIFDDSLACGFFQYPEQTFGDL
ncbi:hypothetical protein [Arthrobacter rhombi]|uniref:hypothetical protein n=1 Tax=Arthrobacter rhombi TaxID=71253 RepID=UPI003FCEE705